MGYSSPAACCCDGGGGGGPTVVIDCAKWSSLLCPGPYPWRWLGLQIRSWATGAPSQSITVVWNTYTASEGAIADPEFIQTGPTSFLSSFPRRGTVIANSLPSGSGGDCAPDSVFDYETSLSLTCVFDGSEDRFRFIEGSGGGGQPSTCDDATDAALFAIAETYTEPGQLTYDGCPNGVPAAAMLALLLAGLEFAPGYEFEVEDPGVFEWL